jgi:hypothetical protein
MLPQCGSWFAKFALSLQSAQVCALHTQDHCINTQQVISNWESSWRQMRNEEDLRDPLGKAIKHRPTAVYNTWVGKFDPGRNARLHMYLSTCIATACVFSMARFRLVNHGLRVDRGRWEGGKHIDGKGASSH